MIVFTAPSAAVPEIRLAVCSALTSRPSLSMVLPLVLFEGWRNVPSPRRDSDLFQFVGRNVGKDEESVRPSDPDRALGEFHPAGELLHTGVGRDAAGELCGIIGGDVGGFDGRGQESEEQWFFHGSVRNSAMRGRRWQAPRPGTLRCAPVIFEKN